VPMKNPPHPGGFVLRQCIEPLGLSITNAAAALGVTRTTLSELVNGKRGISGAVRSCPCSRRPDEAETTRTRVGVPIRKWSLSGKAPAPRERGERIALNFQCV
jgi:transcriptional regulator with XRE-family HTH domain